MIDKELKKRNIPDFFKRNGKTVASQEEWKEYSSSLKELFLKEEYGFLPEKLTPSIKIEPQMINFAGKANWESVYFTFKKEEKEHTVRVELILPKNKKNIPVFLCVNFGSEIPNKYLPAEEIIDNGFGIFTFCYQDVTSDNNDFTNGLCALFENSDKNEYSFGKISIWSYMASVCMDYLCTREEIDNKNVAIIGHSRLGKTALLTSALDERFILTCANDSGCSGAAISRGKEKGNETLDDIITTFPWWFCKNHYKYKNAPNDLPFDQHMLLSLIAPRYLVIGGAVDDVWADNEGQLLSCYLSSYAWRLHGKQGLIMPKKASLEVNDAFLNGEVGFYLREGSHFFSRYDWNVYMKKFKEILKRDI
ncbi:MAG: hypothetical protein IJZ93_05280 [Clostridia bacterium]|nr:hypothetical protein [Clostridia bacterium]